ncbi:hypothetical protein [Acinetobacter baumannii]|uniref:hypothetical protein n=1 Tax=Acinetobacter baumannii TaxID=470 RepID=UPI003133CB8B
MEHVRKGRDSHSKVTEGKFKAADLCPSLRELEEITYQKIKPPSVTAEAVLCFGANQNE